MATSTLTQLLNYEFPPTLPSVYNYTTAQLAWTYIYHSLRTDRNLPTSGVLYLHRDLALDLDLYAAYDELMLNVLRCHLTY